MPIYMRKGKRIDQQLMNHYSSHQAVISKDSLTVLFKQLGLL
jgi:hypothetical protein